MCIRDRVVRVMHLVGVVRVLGLLDPASEGVEAGLAAVLLREEQPAEHVQERADAGEDDDQGGDDPDDARVNAEVLGDAAGDAGDDAVFRPGQLLCHEGVPFGCLGQLRAARRPMMPTTTSAAGTAIFTMRAVGVATNVVHSRASPTTTAVRPTTRDRTSTGRRVIPSPPDPRPSP